MSQSLPSFKSLFRFGICMIFIGCLPCVHALDGAENEDEPEDEEEVVKQLVFIEQHLAETGILDGIESPYDVLVSPDGKHVYVASLKTDSISRFLRDESLGSLSYLGFTKHSTSTDGVRSLAFSPDGENVYAVSMFSDSLATFSRNAGTGELTFVSDIEDSDGGVDGLNGPRSVAISPDGKNLYVAAYDDHKLSAFSRNGSSGGASFLGVYEEGDQGVEELSQPHAVSVSPDGKHVYVALWKNEVVVFSRNASTGLLSYSSKTAYLTGESRKESPRSMVFSPDGKFAYVASYNNDAITYFSRNLDTGALGVLGNIHDDDAEVDGMDGPHDLSISSDGKYVYVAAFSSDSVSSFERDSETGELSFYQSISAGTEDEWDMNGPISIGTSPDGEHVYVGSGSGTHSIVSLKRDILVDPPEFVVLPIDQVIEEGENAAFHALAQGVELSYQWQRNGSPIAGEISAVLSLNAVGAGENGNTFSVVVTNPGGSIASDPVSLSVLPPIVVDPPADLTALDISSNSARLAWKDLSNNETNFEIERREPGGEFSLVSTVSENQSQYDDSTLEASTTYIYRIRAKRLTNVSTWSNDAVIESYDDAPQAPVGLKVTEQSYNRVELRWSDRSAVEDGFRIMRQKDEVGALWDLVDTVEKNATTYLDRGVEQESTYAYRIQAFNESGNSEYSNSVVAITSTIPVDSITPTSRPISKEAISGYSIAVSSAEEWEALSDVDWLIVTSPAEGKGLGNQGVVYRSRLNESQAERIGTIVVGGLAHTVVQEASPPFLRISPSLSKASASSGSILVEIESNQEWTVTEDSEWVSIVSGQEGTGYGTIVLRLDENLSFDTRFAEITINSRTHTIEQAGNEPILELTASQVRFPSAGGSGSVAIRSNEAWRASVSETWLRLTSENSGEGLGEIQFELDENLSLENRTADLLVNNKAISILQEPPPISDVPEPEWVRITVGPLGAELVWEDLADTETGFRIRRKVSGSEVIEFVTELPPDSSNYFDRDAPRGKTVEYSISAVDEFGESERVFATSELIPSANMTAVALRVEAEMRSRAFLAEIALAGEGSLGMYLEGQGENFERMSWGRKYPNAKYAVDTDNSEFELAAPLGKLDWTDYFSEIDLTSENWFSENADGVTYAARTLDASEVYPRGARALGQLLSADSKVVVGFEIEGGFELPILIQAVGLGLLKHGVVNPAEALRLELYSVSPAGAATLLAVNANWQTWTNVSTISIDDALGQTDGSRLMSEAGEARILMMLGSGRYLAVLSSSQGETGSAMLEVFDAR